MTTLSEMRYTTESKLKEIRDGFRIDKDAYQLPNSEIHTALTESVRFVFNRYVGEHEEGEIDEDTVDDIATEVREQVEEMVSEPHEFAVQEHRPAQAVVTLAANYDAVSNAYDEHGGDGGGTLDESILSAVNAWNLACATRVAGYWEEKSEEVYNVLVDLD